MRKFVPLIWVFAALALANLRRALNAAAGPGSLRLMETQPEYKDAATASRNAALAAVIGEPQLALGLLLRAQQLEPRNPAHLVNLQARPLNSQ
ncbi:hypothetical protein [Meiothermus hypogaeus]|uniref:Uncharacterized protein n=2 Tax=Meiothermus hypogaeus TaxID=884155 RepID=A0A511R232_9DEIN|nr:hypothetical protein [Meiothermus hypogaeus]RIH77349.1 hypothetical protein Mhypo_02058 [Meiothermus hypogaeus]GEM82912.1 hypothetical protein MHY01S_10780 [Meiothermus hypogaeus NBRC 106114]